MTLQQLRYVASIAECGSLSKAARELYIAQPSLSKAIAELEKEIQKSLFVRTPRGVLFTDEGTEFLAYARQVLQQMDTLEKRYEIGSVNKHYFTVSSQHYPFASEAFSKVVDSVKDELYEFMYIETQTQDIIDNVHSLKSEVGLLYLSPLNSTGIRRVLKEAHLIFEPIFETLPYACMRRDHPLGKRTGLTLPDLAPYPFLSYNQSHSNTYSMSEIILEPFHIKKHLIVSDRSSATSLMLYSDAYCITAGAYPGTLHDESWVYIPIYGQEKLIVGQIRNEHMMISKLALRVLEALQDIVGDI